MGTATTYSTDGKMDIRYSLVNTALEEYIRPRIFAFDLDALLIENYLQKHFSFPIKVTIVTHKEEPRFRGEITYTTENGNNRQIEFHIK